ncbi:MAG: zinc ribbon domain-containing protein [Candidatus Bathyarchaeota archaeon]|nr:zinc ribbon domain-containing protein [Candidatus Bathyarchaeota archaeon]
MVYCTRCGTFNPDTAINCSNCGAPLPPPEGRPYGRYEHRRYYGEGYRYRREGSGIGLLIVGLFIVLFGLAAFFGFANFWRLFWAGLIILIGVWVISIGLRHNRRYRQPPPS